jgi:ubiquinone/menaquinone biosynthesis C-methylase UbiE
MLPRVLEPEVMDTATEATDYDAMDHSAVNRRLVEDFLAIWNGLGPILDVGTGTVQIPIVLCQMRLDAQVVAVDYAEAMLRIGRDNVARAELTERIRVERCDAKQMPFPDESFGALISNSIVHHIPSPRSVLIEMKRVVKPGGWLFVRDLLRPNDDASVLHLVRTYAGEANRHQQQMFEDSLRAALTLEEIRELVSELGFSPESVRQTTDRHWTWATRRNLTDQR